MKLSAFFLDPAQLGDRKQAYGIEREMQGSSDRFPVFADALRQRCNGLLDTAIEQKLNQCQVFKRRDRLALVCADVSVDEVAHIRLVLFEVDLFIVCQLDRLPQVGVALDLILNIFPIAVFKVFLCNRVFYKSWGKRILPFFEIWVKNRCFVAKKLRRLR